MSVEEYLKHSGKPNCEYIDGFLRPKPMPTKAHAMIQRRVMELLSEQGVEALQEVTVRLSATQYLIPDVIADRVIEDPYPTKPVMLCVEILSPEDRLSAALAKCDDYFTWGVPHCWVIDPIKQVAWEYQTPNDLVKIEAGQTLQAGSLTIHMNDLFPR